MRLDLAIERKDGALPPHQRLVLDPLRLIRVNALPPMQIRLVLLVIPLKPRIAACSSDDVRPKEHAR